MRLCPASPLLPPICSSQATVSFPPVVSLEADFVCEGSLKQLPKNMASTSSTANLPRRADQEMATIMWSEMYRAVDSGDISYFQKPVEDQCPWNQPNLRGNTILHIAAFRGHDQLVELIQRSRQDLANNKNSEGDIPLHVAVRAGHLSTTEILLLNGGQRVTNCEENTPLHVALEKGHQQVARVLMDSDPEGSCYPVVNKEDVLKTVLTSNVRDALLNVKDDEGLTPLSYAASTGYLDVDGVRHILKEYPVCAYRVNNEGMLPIHVACSQGNVNIIKEFLLCCPESGEMLTNINCGSD